jgi:lipopolysaccharide/colanic/teichoic acid biosynthesis glycosyltransferase
MQLSTLGNQQTISPSLWPGLTEDISPSIADRTIYFALKRCIDIVGAAVLILLLSPLLILIAILIKLETPGRVIFAQERIGSKRCYRDGKRVWQIQKFQFYKFRSMFRDADQTLHLAYIRSFVRNQAEKSSDSRACFKLVNDNRITRIGRILRRTSLDELPQLVNVLKGEMSLVGPRPVPEYEVAEYQPQHWKRLAALPGITGLWQINGRGQVSFDEMLQMDLEYVRAQSFWLDVKILLGTIPAVLLGKGAR